MSCKEMHNLKARIIALYLPQFHPIPENNIHWGKGFTEWTNVVQARPLFKGHYQPKLPADLGFYDLRLSEVREAQAQMAKENGVEGFMYWHYWMGNQKLLLEHPFQEVLKSKKPDFPFCLGWANHSWSTKTWTKGGLISDKMIAEQIYPGIDDIIQHFNYVLPAFCDSRYINVERKPFFLIYDPFSIPRVSEFIDIWQNLAVKAGLKGIHFVGLRYDSKHKNSDLLNMGFDAVNNRSMVEAEYKAKRSKYFKKLNSYISFKTGLTLQKYEYSTIVKYLADEENYIENVYPTMLPGYDRTPRAGRKAVIYYGNNPKAFGEHVDNILEYVKNKPFERKVIILKSWNEWGEGNYMEPDLHFGHGFLNELKKRVVS